MSDRVVTAAEALVLDAFVALELTNGGWAPTLEEVGDHIGIGRPTVHAHAQRLVGLGLLEYRLTDGGKARYRARRDTLERARLAPTDTLGAAVSRRTRRCPGSPGGPQSR
jgi:hypothetical protein